MWLHWKSSGFESEHGSILAAILKEEQQKYEGAELCASAFVTVESESLLQPWPGGGVFSIFFGRDMPFFSVSFSPIFLERGGISSIKRRQFFWSRFSKYVKKGEILLDRAVI